MRKIITEREEIIVCKQYIDNWTIRKIAAYANLSQTTVMAILKRRNIRLRDGKRISENQENQVVELYNAGLSIIDIINKTEVKSGQTIYRILSNARIKRRRNTKK